MIITDVIRTLERYKMLEGTSAVIVGLSGGADSVCLFDIMSRLCPERGITLYAAHINHLLRGEAADADERFVTELCEKKGVKLFTLRYDVSSEAKKRAIGTEQCGREVRYRFFDECAATLENCRIATAHTLSDNAETVLFNIARGAGTAGICGIPPVRANIIRPLIGIQREQVEHYCEENSLLYVTDLTNLEDCYSRNVIRHNAVPVFRGINPAFCQAVGRLSDSAAQDESYIAAKAAELMLKADCGDGSLSLEAIRNEPYPLVRRVCGMFINKELDYDKSHKLYSLITGGKTSDRLQLSRQCYAEISYGRLIFTSGVEISEPFEVKVIVPETPLPDGRILVVGTAKGGIPESAVVGTLTVRSRREGDAMRLKNGHSKTLKRLFIDKKIPKSIRDKACIVTDGEKILFAERIGLCGLTERSGEQGKGYVFFVKQN